jgi:soluble lytic murein transglycosylase-like protein
MKTVLLSLLISSSCLASSIENQIASEARKQGLDPRIAIAVATVESSLNPKAVGPKGELGLFQLHPKFFKSVGTQENIRLGIKHLLYWKNNCPASAGYEFVNCYNQGKRSPRYPKLFPYYKKVSAALAVRK